MTEVRFDKFCAETFFLYLRASYLFLHFISEIVHHDEIAYLGRRRFIHFASRHQEFGDAHWFCLSGTIKYARKISLGHYSKS